MRGSSIAGVLVAGVVGLAGVGGVRSAGACYLENHLEHRRDPAFAADVVPPGVAEVLSVDVRQATENDDDESSCVPQDCGDYGVAIIRLQAMDDLAPQGRIGYRFRIASGTQPPNLELGPNPGAGDLRFYFDWADSGFAFVLEVRAVDLNGNLGPPVDVLVTKERNSACAGLGCASYSSGLFSMALIALAALVGRRRRTKV